MPHRAPSVPPPHRCSIRTDDPLLLWVTHQLATRVNLSTGKSFWPQRGSCF